MEENNTSLNPCFSGGWSRRPLRGLYLEQLFFVLILVLVEDGLGDLVSSSNRRRLICLNPCFSGGWSRRSPKHFLRLEDKYGLNPCFSGGWSRRRRSSRRGRAFNAVLILVLVEDGLGEYESVTRDVNYKGLNPCFSGGWSRRATFESVCQQDCYNDIFNFVNVWRPKICTFSGVITDANLRIFGECEHVFRGYFGVFLCRCLIKKVGT